MIVSPNVSDHDRPLGRFPEAHGGNGRLPKETTETAACGMHIDVANRRGEEAR